MGEGRGAEGLNDAAIDALMRAALQIRAEDEVA